MLVYAKGAEDPGKSRNKMGIGSFFTHMFNLSFSLLVCLHIRNQCLLTEWL
jgi:hypothetical protein